MGVIFGYENYGEWRKLDNGAFNDLFSSPNISTAKSLNLKWMGEPGEIRDKYEMLAGEYHIIKSQGDEVIKEWLILKCIIGQ